MKSLFFFIPFLAISLTLQAQSFKPPQFNHMAILVVDLKQSSAFYSDILKLDTIPEPFHDGKHTWFRLGSGTSLHVIQGAEKMENHNQGNHLSVSTDNITAFIKYLSEKKVPWTDASGTPNKTTTRPDGVQQVWLRDPDGYWIEVNNSK